MKPGLKKISNYKLLSDGRGMKECKKAANRDVHKLSHGVSMQRNNWSYSEGHIMMKLMSAKISPDFLTSLQSSDI